MTWNVFSPLNSISTIQWDQNYNILVQLATVPCTIAGTNTLALTINVPNGNPPITAYVNNQIFCGIATATNTTAANAAVGTLPALNIYKDTAAGPVVLTGGEIVIKNYIALAYDSTLNGGAGGFHLKSDSLTAGDITGNLSLPSSTATLSIPSSTSTVQVGGSLFVGQGSIAGVTHIVSSLASIAFTAINPAGSSLASIVVAGAKQTDNVNVAYSTVSLGISYDGFVSAANTVVVKASNITAGTITPPSGIYRVTAMGFT